MRQLKSLLDATLQPHAASWQLQLAAKWEMIVGNLSSIMTIEKLYGATLIVGVYEQSWIAELHMLSSMIIKTINEHINGIRIEKIQFKLAKKRVLNIKTIPVEIINIPVTLTSQEQKAVDHIKDIELQTLLKTFLISCKKRRAYRDNKNSSI